MADIRAFRAWHYNLARVGELSGVVAPPYDVIDPAQQDALYQRHPANVVRLILNRAMPHDSDADNSYVRAAKLLRQWKADGTLVQDPDPALYVYHQEFKVDGESYTRRGFLASLKLEEFGSGKVYPHEETMPEPKQDRLRLFQATGTNLSPIFAMYPDRENEVQEILDQAIRNWTPIEACDDSGVVNRIWPLGNDEVITRVRGLMGRQAIYIADGHHRYETALAYRDLKRGAGKVTGEDGPESFTLCMLVSMNDPGLLVLPTHRLVSGLTSLTGKALRDSLAGDWDIELLGSGPGAGRDLWQQLTAAGGQKAIGLAMVADDEWMLAAPRDTAILETRFPQRSRAWRELGVVILHELLLESLAARATAEGHLQVRYIHRLDDVLYSVAQRQCEMACLVPPMTADLIQQIASGGERLPSKSTYFYPKMLSGLVFHPIA